MNKSVNICSQCFVSESINDENDQEHRHEQEYVHKHVNEQEHALKQVHHKT